MAVQKAGGRKLEQAGQQAIGERQGLQCGRVALARRVAEQLQQRQRQAGGQREVEFGRGIPPAEEGALGTALQAGSLDDAGQQRARHGQVRAPGDLEAHFHWHGDAFTDGQVIDTITPKRGSNTERDKSFKAEPVWDPVTHPGSWRAVWVYSKKRAARDSQTLTAQANRARAVIAGEKRPKGTRFVTTHAGDTTLDEASLARARSLVGLKGYATFRSVPPDGRR